MKQINREILLHSWALERKSEYGRKYLSNGTVCTSISVVHRMATFRKIKDIFNESTPYNVYFSDSISRYIIDKMTQTPTRPLLCRWHIWRSVGEELGYFNEYDTQLAAFINYNTDELSSIEMCEVVVQRHPVLAELVPHLIKFEKYVDNLAATITPIYEDATLIHTIDSNLAQTYLYDSAFPMWCALPDTALVILKTSDTKHTCFLTKTATGTMVTDATLDGDMMFALKHLGVDKLPAVEPNNNKFAMLIKNKVYAPHKILLHGIVNFPTFTISHFDKIITTDDYFAERREQGFNDEPTVYL